MDRSRASRRPATLRPAPARGSGRPGGIRATPGATTLLLALVGSTLFVGWGLVARDSTQVPVLCAGFAVYGLVFGTLALGGGRATYAAARSGEAGRAFVWAILGGIAALIAAASVGLAVVLALVLGG